MTVVSRRVIVLLLLVSITLSTPPAFGNPIPAPASEQPLYPEMSETAPTISARAAVLMDATTGRVLFSRNAHVHRHPASTTKVMTLLLALQFGDLDDTVVISRRAAGTPGSSANLRAGERYRLQDLLYGLMLPSGNDAAVAIGEHISGSEERFVSLMNEQARKLGLYDTNFENPHGLTHPRHLSTAFDLALLTRRAIAEPKFLEIACTRWYHACAEGDEQGEIWHNTNRLLWSFPFIEGGKTGTTSAAGQCLIAVARKGRQRLIAVVLNAPNRWRDVKELFNWGFDNFELLQVARTGDGVGTLNVVGGTVPTVPLIITENLVAVVPRHRRGDVKIKYDIPKQLPAPILAFEPVGKVSLTLDDREIAAVSARAEREVGSLTPVRRLVSWILHLFRIWMVVSGGSNYR